MTLRLVHLGSWGNDPGRPEFERIGELEVRDIASYRTRSLARMLDEERPQAVILLSTETFAHRALIRYCRQRSIPTLLLYHGLVNVQVTDDKRGSYGSNRVAYARFVAQKLGKVLKRTLPCYLSALLHTGASLRDWRRFAADSARLALGTSLRTKAADDSRTMACAVYTQADIEHAIRVFGFDASEVKVVGNPDLARFGLTRELLCSSLPNGAGAGREIMYIDTGLPAVGLVFESWDAFFEHLRRTAITLAAAGFSMLLKPHPAHDLERLERGIAGCGITLVPDSMFVPRLRQCAACLAETTTLAMIPALLGMPLFLANYGALSVLRYGRVLTSYPRGDLLQDLSHVRGLLSSEKWADERTQIAVRDWIDMNVGPLPAEAMPDRVAAVIASVTPAAASTRLADGAQLRRHSRAIR
ncbi:MAG: hypothetical protein ABSG30_13750 [Steroidobacteraceae bacterium]|jgi:hypothetical protein